MKGLKWMQKLLNNSCPSNPVVNEPTVCDDVTVGPTGIVDINPLNYASPDVPVVKHSLSRQRSSSTFYVGLTLGAGAISIEAKPVESSLSECCAPVSMASSSSGLSSSLVDCTISDSKHEKLVISEDCQPAIHTTRPPVSAKPATLSPIRRAVPNLFANSPVSRTRNTSSVSQQCDNSSAGLLSMTTGNSRRLINLCTRSSLMPSEQFVGDTLACDTDGEGTKTSDAVDGSSVFPLMKPVLRPKPCTISLQSDCSNNQPPDCTARNVDRRPAEEHKNSVKRHSKRRSFTTEDCDLGFSSGKSRPSVYQKPLPAVLRRLQGTQIGSHALERNVSASLDTIIEKPRPAPPPKPKPADIVSKMQAHMRQTINEDIIVKCKASSLADVREKSSIVVSQLNTKSYFEGDGSLVYSISSSSSNLSSVSQVDSKVSQPATIVTSRRVESCADHSSHVACFKCRNNYLSESDRSASFHVGSLPSVLKFDFNKTEMMHSASVDSSVGSPVHMPVENIDEEITWSSEDDGSFCEHDEHVDSNAVVTTEYQSSPEANNAKRVTDKAQLVAMELLTTEKSYVEKLFLLDQVFHTQLLLRNPEERFVPTEVIPLMFPNVKSIYSFHNEHLLPQLQECMDKWDEGKRIGAVFKKFAPFLKIYKDYIIQFDSACSLISTWTAKSAKFAAFLEDIHAQPICGNLTLQHHLLCPIQRVPRYELLLKEYLKHLAEDSDDRQSAEDALALVTQSAERANDEMKKIEKFRRLLEISDSLGGTLDLVSPPYRELVKEGKVIKLSARDEDRRSERYLFLFSDFLLVCQLLTTLPGLRQQYKVKDKLEVSGMRVTDGNSTAGANTFFIKSKQKTVEVLFSSLDEKIEWMQALWHTIAQYVKKEQARHMPNAISQFSDNELGTRAPTWIKDQETIMCMVCSDLFTMVRRRHHCRACGKVVCGKCSLHQIPLPYDHNRENRVCDACFIILAQKLSEPALAAPVVDKLLKDRTRVKVTKLRVKATDPSILSDYFYLSTDRKSWSKRWCTLHSDFALYWFKAHKDVVAKDSLPLPGYQVAALRESTGGEVPHRELTFRIWHTRQPKIYYFQANSLEQMKRWIFALQYIVQAQLPPNINEDEYENLPCRKEITILAKSPSDVSEECDIGRVSVSSPIELNASNVYEEISFP